MVRDAFGLTLALLVVGPCLPAQQLRWEPGAFIVSGWTPPAAPPNGGWASVLSVYAGGTDVPALLGVHSIENGELRFRPRFPLSPGLRVRAVFHPLGKQSSEHWFNIPAAPAKPRTQVEQVYPSASVIPENQLKFYLRFSGPMRRGEAWKHIRLLDGKGVAVELPFLEIDQELWDPEARRLTVLFDPGRIKRGVLPLEETGPALEAGKRYTLEIDPAWADAAGAPLKQPFQKTFAVGPPDRDPPDPARWTIESPHAGSSQPLKVRFTEPLDYALLQRLLQVRSAGGFLGGTVEVGANEAEWLFTPLKPWQPGEYKLTIDTALEDLAGNRIGKPFDVDTFDKVSRTVVRTTTELPFRVSSH